jgi:hypothetical protein
MNAHQPRNAALEIQIEQWRSYLRRRQAIHAADVEELEDHLREQMRALGDAGLAPDEAFLVAVKRMGSVDALAHEFAREHSGRLWKQLLIAPAAGPAHNEARNDALVAFALGATAALLFKLPVLFGMQLDGDEDFYLRNFALFVLPLLTGYFAWKRQLPLRTCGLLAAGFLLAAVVMNAYPFVREGHTQILAGLHLPIALWLLTGVAYAGGRWGEVSGRMDFVRFTGELVIYYALIALGGGVLMALTAMTFEAIGVDVERVLGEWLVPCGALGAVLVAAWLVEAKQSVIENMAPVLTRLFTPLFTAVLVVFLATVAFTGRGIDIERNVLIAFDLVLVVVVGLLLYSISARDPDLPPDGFDWLQVALVLSALAADAVMLWAIGGRIAEYGASPNRVAALGENVILLVNLAWSAVLYLRFLRGRGTFPALERWQTAYLPVYAGWAAIVVVLFPPVFGFA